MNILDQFGIEGKLLVVQLINFAIFALVMWKFVLPRITKLLDDRKQTVERSLAEAEQARQDAEAAQVERDAQAAAARTEADRVIAEATEQAQTAAAEIMAQAKTDAERIRRQAEEQLAAERIKLRAELRAELGSLAVATTRRVLDGVVTKKDSARMVAAAEKKLTGGKSRGRR